MLIVLPLPLHAQSSRDEETYVKLEQEVRNNFDKEVAKFTKSKPAVKASPSTPSPSALTSAYDKFKDQTLVTVTSTIHCPVCTPRVLTGGTLGRLLVTTDLTGSYTYVGAQYSPPLIATLFFKTTNESPIFGVSASFIVIADGKRYRLGNALQSLQRATAAEIYEINTVSIPFEALSEIANATNVEAQLGNIDFTFSNDNLNALRRLVGLEERQQGPTSLAPSSKVDSSVSRVATTTWLNHDGVGVTFNVDGTLSNTNGTPNGGKWLQGKTSDMIRFEFSRMGTRSVRTLGVGVIKDNYMVNCFTVKGSIFGDGTSCEVLQLTRPR